MYLFFSSLMLTATMFFMASHPISIMSSILIMALIICLALWTWIASSWFSFILFLIFLGGLMVLFVYIVTLASNEIFKINLKQETKFIIMMTSVLFLIFCATFFNPTSMFVSSNFFVNISLIISKSVMILTLIIMSYLLYALVVAVKISSKFEGPLRNFVK